MERLGIADDFQDADGKDILTYAQAQSKALAWFQGKERGGPDYEPMPSGTFTVADAKAEWVYRLLVGGDKDTQANDVERAKVMKREMERGWL